MKKSFAVVISGGSRSGRKLAVPLCKMLGDTAEFVEVSRSSEHLATLVRRALKEGVEQVWVAGGDGSVRTAAGILAGGPARLAILPLGTGNSLARELGIPTALEEAVEFHQTKAILRKIDVGWFEKEPFVNVATLGLTTKIMEEVQNSNKGAFGRLVYLPAMVKAYSLTKPFHLEVETDYDRFHGEALQFVAAATRLHGGPFPVSPDAAIDDGKLSIYVVSQTNRANLVRFGVALLLGKQTELPEVWNVESVSAKVSLRTARKFVLDGDPLRTKTASIHIDKQTLLVLAAPPEEA